MTETRGRRRPSRGRKRRPVGLIGTGTIGVPVGMHLLKQHVPLVVTSRTRRRAQPLVERGAVWAPTPREVAMMIHGNAILLALPDGAAAKSVLFGPGGVVDGARVRTLIVNLSTISPEEALEISRKLRRRHLRYVEAPFTGSKEAAQRGKLTVFAGGSPRDTRSAQRLLKPFVKSVFAVGPVGKGTAMKLVNNLITLSTVALDSEAISLAEAFGLRRERVIALLQQGGANSAMLISKAANFAKRKYTPPAFSLDLAIKDLGLICGAARRRNVRTPIASNALRLARRRLRSLSRMSRQGRSEDFSAMFESARAS